MEGGGGGGGGGGGRSGSGSGSGDGDGDGDGDIDVDRDVDGDVDGDVDVMFVVAGGGGVVLCVKYKCTILIEWYLTRHQSLLQQCRNSASMLPSLRYFTFKNIEIQVGLLNASDCI